MIYREILQVRKSSLRQPLLSEIPEPLSKIYIERKQFPSQFRDPGSKGRKKDPVYPREILCPASLLCSVTGSRGSSFSCIGKELNSETDGRIVADIP